MSVATATALRLGADGLAHRYGARIALDPLSFAIESPGVVAITGPNGSGKSTLLRILIGLLRPSQGTTRFERDGASVAPRERRRFAGLATPELAFYEELSAAENLAFAAETRGLPDVRAAVRGALEAVGLARRADDRVAALSSGMKQRLRLAFAVLHRPVLLMLDEPGSHLDEEGRARMAGLVRAHASTGLVLIATNDPQEMLLAERRIELSHRDLDNPS